LLCSEANRFSFGAIVSSEPKRKFLSEHAVGFNSSRWLGITPEQLNTDKEMGALEKEVASKCHVYLICSRPSISYNPMGFSFDGKIVKGNFTVKSAGNTKIVPFSLPITLSGGAVGVRLSPHPYREIHSVDANGEVINYWPANMFGLEITKQPDLYLLKVLYVGQAYANGTRSAFDRLKSHSTLQKILADLRYSSPDDDILILAFEYDQYRVFTTIDGKAKDASAEIDGETRYLSILKNPLDKYQQVCLVEAGLIRYFEPMYNDIYKESFPAQDQKILSQVYSLDFSALIVEINTDERRFSLYSDSVPPSQHHSAKFELFDPHVRRSFFGILGKDGQVMKMAEAIPPTRR